MLVIGVALNRSSGNATWGVKSYGRHRRGMYNLYVFAGSDVKFSLSVSSGYVHHVVKIILTVCNMLEAVRTMDKNFLSNQEN